MKNAHVLVVLAKNALQLTSTKQVFSEAVTCAKFGSTQSVGEKLKTNMIDGYWLHRQEEWFPSGLQQCRNATILASSLMQERGKILAFGQMFPKKLACAKKFAHGPRSEKQKIMTTIREEDDAEWVFLAYIMPDAQ